MDRVRRELGSRQLAAHKQERRGSEVEGCRNPATKMWQPCPPIAATESRPSSFRQAVANNRLLMKMLQLLTDAHTLVGNVCEGRGHTWCTREAAHSFFLFTEQRVCPMHGNWPDVNACLNPEY